MTAIAEHTPPRAQAVQPQRAMPALLLLPALTWIAVFFLLPLVLMCWRSLAADGYSFKAYWIVFSSPLYTKVMLTTLESASIATVLALLLAYPMAYALTITRGVWRGLLLMFVFIPYWVDIIVRTFSWLILLGDHGLINGLLTKARHRRRAASAALQRVRRACRDGADPAAVDHCGVVRRDAAHRPHADLSGKNPWR